MDQMYNPDEIIKKAELISQQASELKKQVERLATIVEAIGTVWQSPAQKRFAAKVQEIQKPLLDFCKQIDTFATDANDQARDVLHVEVE